MKTSLGFPTSAKSVLSSAAALQPTPDLTPEQEPEPAELRKQSRPRPDSIPQMPPKVVRKRAPAGLTNPLNMRVDLNLFNRFVSYSMSLDKSYGKTLEHLLDLAKVPADGNL